MLQRDMRYFDGLEPAIHSGGADCIHLIPSVCGGSVYHFQAHTCARRGQSKRTVFFGGYIFRGYTSTSLRGRSTQEGNGARTYKIPNIIETVFFSAGGVNESSVHSGGVFGYVCDRVTRMLVNYRGRGGAGLAE